MRLPKITLGSGGPRERDRRRIAALSQARRRRERVAGRGGGFGANHQLRQSLVFLNMPTLNQPEAYLGNAAEMIADDRAVAAEPTREFLRGFMTAYEKWVDKIIAA